ncbi:UDP-N-acetylglucosamine--undecaprenyl-phosphate N-acetylglucosaminephosphotransferase [Pseudoalteromonas fenneropenaei]|uniref:Undecaprenyl-phosphate alpha-N-acetylglucosaminyl 1-phosphate transferase n=1 Tax=Pseudoalteromonas fenneropenaei TaxID=1737459 RepID=A0ABV7CKE8_9GAMM
MNSILLLTSCSIFFSSIISLFFFRKVAKIINLVDVPSGRKEHSGQIPLVGGISIFVVVLSFISTQPEPLVNMTVYVSCSFILLAMGVLDDYFDLDFRIRIGCQLLVTLIMIFSVDIVLNDLSGVFSPHSLQIGSLGIFLTIVAVIGAINSFNMIDGIDGLLGGMATVSFGSMCLLFYLAGDSDNAFLCLVIVIATIPYMLMNLGIPFGQRFKVFMGDAGSTVIGFTVVWLLIAGSQGEHAAFSAVTGLWVAAIPIMDAVSTIARRIKKRQSPFVADREHLHHVLMRLGLSQHLALVFISCLALLFAVIGILAEVFSVPSYIMFWLFFMISVCYYLIMSRIWRVTVILRRKLGIKAKRRG